MSKLIYQDYSPQGLTKHKNISHSSRLILRQAEEMGIKWWITPGTQVVTLSFQGKERSFFHQIPSSTTALAKYVCHNKSITTNLLHEAGIKVPKGYRIRRDHDYVYLKEVFFSLTKPLVVKPSDGTWGENITVDVTTLTGYVKAIELALSYSSKKNTAAIVEEQFDGTEYRVLTTREKVIGVLYRRPASVLGDGKSSITKLIRHKNLEPIRSVSGMHRSHLKIRIDQRLKKYLADQKLSLDDVPAKGVRIFLRRVSNISQGGEALDYTDRVHPSVKEISLKAVRAIPGLSFAGVDFMSRDITAKQTKDMYVIIEINDSPGFDIHDYPYQGKNRHAAREFIYLMFPELRKN